MYEAFSLSINVHAQNIEAQKFLLRKTSESYETAIVKKLRRFQKIFLIKTCIHSVVLVCFHEVKVAAAVTSFSRIYSSSKHPLPHCYCIVNPKGLTRTLLGNRDLE